MSIGLGVALAILAALEIFLDERQKQRVSNAAIWVWLRVDSLIKLSAVQWLKRKRLDLYAAPFSLLLALGTTGYLVWPVIIGAIRSDDPNLSHLLMWSVSISILLTIGGIWLGIVIVRALFRVRSAFWLILMASLYLVGVTLFGYAAYVVTDAMVLESNNPMFIELVLTSIMVAWLVLTPFLMLCLEILIFWIVAVLPLLGAFVLTLFLVVSEFIVRRIAEYSKGPIFALSGGLGVIGAFLKAFA